MQIPVGSHPVLPQNLSPSTWPLGNIYTLRALLWGLLQKFSPFFCELLLSHPARGGWIEITTLLSGLRVQVKSHPARGGWIEMICFLGWTARTNRPTPHGVGGLKCNKAGVTAADISPTPHGVGGLKYGLAVNAAKEDKSHPARGGWIEIKERLQEYEFAFVPPRTGWVD